MELERGRILCVAAFVIIHGQILSREHQGNSHERTVLTSISRGRTRTNSTTRYKLYRADDVVFLQPIEQAWNHTRDGRTGSLNGMVNAKTIAALSSAIIISML